MNLTPQQAAFIETVADSDSIALEALAGTGKTFSLQQWGNKSTRPGIATSFSKSTVEELVKKLGSKFPAKTFHAIGLTALKSSGKTTKLDTSKMYNVTKALSEQHDIPFELQGEIRSLATMAKVYGIQPDPAGPDAATAAGHVPVGRSLARPDRCLCAA